MLSKLRRSTTWTKLTNWEYWPTNVVYAPVIFYAFLNSVKTGSPFYYFSANPGIETGGMIIESKYNILKQLPAKNIPKTILVEYNTPFEKIMTQVKRKNILFPLIIKPNYGERGRLVEKIKDEKQLQLFLKEHKSLHMDFIIQEFIDLEIEAAVFYYRYPNEKIGTVSSFIVKNFLSVLGNGKDTIEQLMKNHSRANMQLKKFKQTKPDLLKKIPKKGERVELMPIGSHNRGSKFINKNYLITEKLMHTIDILSKHVKGFYYGRYDVKAKSIEDIYEGNFKVLELNGAKAEPVHIYHPKYPLHKGYRDLFHHWRVMYKISKQNHNLGHRYPKFKEGYAHYKKFKQFHK